MKPGDKNDPNQDREAATIVEKIRRQASHFHIFQGIFFTIFLAGLTLKLSLTSKFTPFGLGTDNRAGIIWNGARMLGYTGSSFGLKEYTTFVGPYLASIILRLNLPIESVFYIVATEAIIVSVLAYFLVEKISGSQTALLTMVLANVNWHWVFWAYYGTAEVRQVMLGIITLILLQRGIEDPKKTYLFSLSSTLFALAFHTKIQAVALTLPVLILFYYGRERLRRDSIPLFLLAFTTLMLALAPFSQSYAFLAHLTEERVQRAPGINLSELLKYLVENLLRIPYEISIPTTAFTIYGLHQLVKKPRSQKDLYLVWFASYFILYTLISERLHKNIGYYSQNWVIPLLIFTATGMQRLLQNQNSTRNQTLVLTAILSTTIEGPLPFIRLTTETPFIVPKDSLICYRRLLAQIRPATERSRFFYQTMSDFIPKIYIIPADIALLTAILLPIAVSLLSKSRLPHSEPETPTEEDMNNVSSSHSRS
jgi:hypothetical protein